MSLRIQQRRSNYQPDSHRPPRCFYAAGRSWARARSPPQPSRARLTRPCTAAHELPSKEEKRPTSWDVDRRSGATYSKPRLRSKCGSRGSRLCLFRRLCHLYLTELDQRASDLVCLISMRLGDFLELSCLHVVDEATDALSVINTKIEDSRQHPAASVG